MISTRRQVREATAENARLNAECRALRKALDVAQQEKKEWYDRAQRFAADLGAAAADAALKVVRPAEPERPGVAAQLADAHRDVQQAQARLDEVTADLAEEQRKTRDLERLLREARPGDGVLPMPSDPGELARLRREVREGRERELALQARLDERQQVSEAADARRVPLRTMGGLR